MKRLFAIILALAVALSIAACGDGKAPKGGEASGGATASGSEKKSNSLSWPTDVAFVPNIPYTGNGSIVYMEKSESDDEYYIYINKATLESANEYIQKLYDNSYTLMWMFRESDETYNPTATFLKKPEAGKSYKLGFDSPDEKIGVVTIIHDGHPKKKDIAYNFVITFANMDY